VHRLLDVRAPEEGVMTTANTGRLRVDRQQAAPWPEAPLLRRIWSEYNEMPGLCLTVPQAARLWNLDRDESERALAQLVQAGFLERTPSGCFLASSEAARRRVGGDRRD
jgi:hypothetical protein